MCLLVASSGIEGKMVLETGNPPSPEKEVFSPEYQALNRKTMN